MTFAEIEVACQGYETRMARIKEVPRVIAGILMNVNREAGSPAYNVEEYIPLYTDKDRKSTLITKDEYEKSNELFNNVKWQQTNLKQS